MGVLGKLMTAVSVPLMILNVFGGIVAGIWLAILGKWGVIGWGIAAMIFGPWIVSLGMLPGLLFAGPAVLLEKRLKASLYFFAFLGSIYTAAVLVVWCMGVLWFFVTKAEAHSIGSLVPVLLWAYGIATGTLSYLAQKDAQGGSGAGALVATFFAQLGFVIVVIAGPLLRLSLLEASIVFAAVMAIGICVQLYVAIAVLAEERAMSLGS
jgi:hypothetical protein